MPQSCTERTICSCSESLLEKVSGDDDEVSVSVGKGDGPSKPQWLVVRVATATLMSQLVAATAVAACHATV